MTSLENKFSELYTKHSMELLYSEPFLNGKLEIFLGPRGDRVFPFLKINDVEFSTEDYFLSTPKEAFGIKDVEIIKETLIRTVELHSKDTYCNSIKKQIDSLQNYFDYAKARKKVALSIIHHINTSSISSV